MRSLADWVVEGTVVVVNDTRVMPARLFGRREATGGKVEILLLEPTAAPAQREPGCRERWRALGRSSKPLRAGTRLLLGEDESLRAEVVGRGADDPAVVEVELHSARDEGTLAALNRLGHMPLPPYVRRADDGLDRERYQTIFARVDGAVAAPTAGLHLSERGVRALEQAGARLATVTLHVGLGTFQPVAAEDLDAHPMHAEWFAVPVETVAAIEEARRSGAPVLAVGTTVVRALESAADDEGGVRATSGQTRLLIQPGYRFRVVDQLLTNFHLPRSTLLALVSAFGGRESVLAAYREAIERGYRFYSYGDAMLLRERADGGPR